jgi:hypothetical protein
METRNARLFLILSGLLFFIVFTIYWYSNSYSSFRATDIDFTVAPHQQVTRIEMITGDERVELKVDEQGRWRLNEVYFANESATEDLLNALSRLTVWQPVSLSMRDSIDRMFREQGSTVNIFVRSWFINLARIKLFPHEQLYQSIVVGADAPDGESTYMKKRGAEQAFRVVRPGYGAGVSSLFNASLKEWLNPVIIDATWDEITSVSIRDFDQEEESFILQNTTTARYAFHHFFSGEPLDASSIDLTRVERYGAGFRQIYYESLLDDDAEFLRRELMLEKPYMEITVSMKQGEQVNLKAFARRLPTEAQTTARNITIDPNRFYILINDQQYALAQYYIFNPILRRLSFFKNKKDNPA